MKRKERERIHKQSGKKKDLRQSELKRLNVMTGENSS